MGNYPVADAGAQVFHDFERSLHADVRGDQRRFDFIQQVFIHGVAASQQTPQAFTELPARIFQAKLQRIHTRLFDRADLYILDGTGGLLVFSEYAEHARRILGLPVDLDADDMLVLGFNQIGSSKNRGQSRIPQADFGSDPIKIKKMSRKKPGTVRIIGGSLRGRRLPVPDLAGLRPSGDRGREALFNWLAPRIRGARCADLFAGTGVLGIEAASRGAQSVVLVEKSAQAARAIRQNLDTLKTSETSLAVELVRGDALGWLESCASKSLDIVFVDPPFDSGLEVRALSALVDGDCLAEGGLVYLETARQAKDFEPGPAWDVVKDKTLGEVRMRLLKKLKIICK